MKEEKETKTYRFEIEVINHAEENPLISSFAEWCCLRYREEFMEIETLSLKMQTYFNMANDCKIQIKNLKKKEKEGSNLNGLAQHEIAWLKTEAPRRIKNATFEGVYKAFVNTYNKQEINRRQFRLIIEKLTGEKLPQKTKNKP